MISINDLVHLIGEIAGKSVIIKNVSGPRGVMGRNSHNQLIQQSIGWAPPDNLELGLRETYQWIQTQIQGAKHG
jgi:nucleoside-diphosphate-sugar epimerase